MIITIDSSTPAMASYSGPSQPTINSNPVSPPTGSLLVVCVSDAVQTRAASITDNGPHLTYLPLVNDNDVSTNEGASSIWVADVDTAPGSMVVTAHWAAATLAMGLAVIVLTGAAQAPQQLGATAHNNADTGATQLPTLTLAPRFSNSLIMALMTNWTNSTVSAAPSGQSQLFGSNSQNFSIPSLNEAGWVQRLTSQVNPTGTPVTINNTDALVAWDGVAVEIVVRQPVYQDTVGGPNILGRVRTPTIIYPH